MKVVRTAAEAGVPETGSTLAIGTFDGVHIGHRSLIEGTVDAGAAQGASSGIVTWDRHPLATLRPEGVPPLITSADRKLELLEALGADFGVVLAFDEELASWPPERFVEEVLVAGLHARLVRVGHDWRFGRRAAGDTRLLARLGAESGFEVDAVRLERLGSGPISSTRIRRAVEQGELELARTLLGRPFDNDGVVVRGDGRGASLGFPTANLDVDPALVRPAEGVYAGRIRVHGVWHAAAINVGKNLTFGGQAVRIEAFILDFDKDIYGEKVRLEFWGRLRDELKFDSIAALVDQMETDVRRTRELIPIGKR